MKRYLSIASSKKASRDVGAITVFKSLVSKMLVRKLSDPALCALCFGGACLIVRLPGILLFLGEVLDSSLFGVCQFGVIPVSTAALCGAIFGPLICHLGARLSKLGAFFIGVVISIIGGIAQIFIGFWTVFFMVPHEWRLLQFAYVLQDTSFRWPVDGLCAGLAGLVVRRLITRRVQTDDGGAERAKRLMSYITLGLAMLTSTVGGFIMGSLFISFILLMLKDGGWIDGEVNDLLIGLFPLLLAGVCGGLTFLIRIRSLSIKKDIVWCAVVTLSTILCFIVMRSIVSNRFESKWDYLRSHFQSVAGSPSARCDSSRQSCPDGDK